MTTLDVGAPGLMSVPADTARQTARSLRRLRRRKRQAQRRLWIAAGAGGLCAVTMLAAVAVWRPVRFDPPEAEVKAAKPVPVDLGRMALTVEGGSADALAQGFRDCVNQNVRITCYHPAPSLVGIPATSLSLSLSGPNGMRDAEDVREARFHGVTFRFAESGDDGLVRLDAALRRAGWQRSDGVHRTSYYRRGVLATITLSPDVGSRSINAVVRPAAPAFVEAQLHLIRMQAQQQRKRQKELEALIARMNS